MKPASLYAATPKRQYSPRGRILARHRFVARARAQGEWPEMGLQGAELERWAEWAIAQADRMDPLKPSPTSILDDAERIEHLCDQLQWRR
jgi:hypothetical protein